MHGLTVYLSISFSQVLVAAVEGHLDLVRELVEQHRADLLHKASVSSASYCVIHLFQVVASSVVHIIPVISTPVLIKETLQSIGWDINILTYLVVNSLCSVAQ